MFTRLHIRLSPTATLAALQDTFRQHPEMESVAQTVRRGNMIVLYVVSDDARPVNLFCRQLVEAEVAGAVTVERLDV